MGKYKIVAVDLDGTVLNKEKKISRENIKIFNLCKNNNIEVIPVTGRPVSGLYDEYIKSIGCRYAINSNGAVAIDLKKNRELINSTIDIQTTENILDVLDKYQCYYSIFYKGYGYLNEANYNRELEKYKNTPLYEYVKITRRKVKCQREFVHSINHCDNIYVTAKTTEIRDKICLEIKNLENIFITCSDVDDVEIGGNCSKGKTLLQLADMLGVKREEILAIGDSGNDITMIEMAGLGVAMGNGSEAIKKVADYVTKPCQDNGVAYAVEKFCFTNFNM